MMDTAFFTIIGIGLIGTMMAVLLKQYHPIFAVMVTVAVSVIILMTALQWLTPIIEQGQKLLQQIPALSEHTQILFKTVGICFLTQLSSGLCRDAGESAIAVHIETAGKLLILAVSLPMFGQILVLVMIFLGM